MKKGEIIDCDIEKLVFGGMGIATIDGLKVFIAETVPGDRAKVRITKKKAHYAEGKLLEIIRPSVKRTIPFCRHFGICGGCTWQFLSYPDQLTYKEAIVKESLEHIGDLQNIDLKPIVGCAMVKEYRNKMEFSFAYDEQGKADIGLHPKGFHYDVFTLIECYLPSPQYTQLVLKIREWLQTFNISIYQPRTDSGLLKTVVIRNNQKQELLINFITTKGAMPHSNELLAAIKDSNVISLFQTEIHARKGKPTTRKVTLIWGKDYLSEELSLGKPWGNLRFNIYPEAFFQPNPQQAQKLYALALDAANIQSSDTVLDLYCGTGTLGLFASRRAKHVIGVDNVPDAIKSAQANAQQNNISNIELHTGDAAQILSQISITPTIAIIDPPRAGMMPETIELLTKLPLQRLVYISCNPTTQARDIKLLQEHGYVFQYAQPVDMFPHTYHIENIAVLRKMSATISL
ncbi:MAG: 23S rRNA (uracil(1939)-C(5))-methyltransferase RlmD [Candidatus Abawacabacteria bacterium]|nr:23S rRNA (uracil(1939)-C(5))-methyltransferase RlmD [Candidatus Abawacabacteria bacterium]